MDQQSCVVCIILDPSAKFFLNLSYFTSKGKSPGNQQTGEKMGCYEVIYYIFGVAQIWMKGYILDMGFKSVLSKPTRNKKNSDAILF